MTHQCDIAGFIGPKIVVLGVLLGIGVPFEAPAQTLNMSHDLVRLGIASQNLTPDNPSLDARPLFQAALQYVQGHPTQTLTLDKGAYYLMSATGPNAVLSFPSLNNVTIDLAGSTIYFNGPQLPNGLDLYYCSNVTLTNFQIDYLHPPYTHVELIAVDTVNRILQYQTLQGWPDPASFNTLTNPLSGGPIEGLWAAIFRNGAIVPGTSRTLLRGPITNNTLVIQDTFPWAQTAALSTLQAGDTIVVTARGGGPPVLVWEGNSVTLSNISIYGSPTWAVELYQTSNSLVDSLRVMPRPGSGLIGSNADGIHFAAVGQNNHIRNSYVTHTMDDALIMESPHTAVVSSQSGLRQLTVTRNGYLRFPNGTAMNFVDPNTTLEFAGATIVAQDPPDASQLAFSGQVSLTFDSDLPAIAPGTIMVFGTPALRGKGSTIDDNVVEDTYGGRGIWISGAEGLTIQRNVLRRTSMAGIILQQETDAAVDTGDLGPPASDVTIVNNSLEGILGPAAAGTGEQSALGAIEVVSTNNQSFGFASGAANTNVTIVNNYIADAGRSGIWIGELNAGSIQNNLVIRSSQNPTLGGTAGIPPVFQEQVIQDALTAIAIRYSSGVIEGSNTIDRYSTTMAPVNTTPRNITLPAAGGNGSFQVNTAVSGFGWQASTTVDWISLAAPGSGTGIGTVSYFVSPNSSSTSREATIVVAGEPFTITQVASVPFTITNLGGVSLTSPGSGASTQTGFALIQPASGSAPPEGVAIFDYRPNGILLSETAVPASVTLISGLMYAEIGGGVDAGFAIANPNNSTASINFTFRDTSGTAVGSGSTSIAPYSQVAVFLDQSPYNGPTNFQGTFSFISNVPVGAVAVRSLLNQRGDFLMSTLPVIDTTAAPISGTVVVPHFSDGGGWTTQIFLVNPTSTATSGNIQFKNNDGTPATVTIGAQTATSFPYAVPAWSAVKLATSGASALVSGSVRIVPSGSGVTPTPLVTFSYTTAGITVSEAGVLAVSGTAFRMYVELAGTDGLSGGIQSGLAIANNGSAAATVTLSLTDLTGSAVGTPVTVNIPASGHVAEFLNQFFAGQTLPNPFKGLVRISTASSVGVSVVGLRARYNERLPVPDFLITTTPPMLESNSAPTGQLLFPDLADGAGYKTQFLLFSGTAGQASLGLLFFFQPSGLPLVLPLN